MALTLALVSLLPVLVGFLALGDFPQLVFKPPLWFVQAVFRSRFVLIALSILLYLSAVIVHWLVAPTSLAGLIVVGVLLFLLLSGAFVVERILLFPTIQRHPTWISQSQAMTELAPRELVLVIDVNGDTRAYPTRWIERPHIVCDTVGGEPVAMTYCALSHLGKAFRAESAGKAMKLTVALQLENNLVYYDRTGNQLVQQITGTVLCGNMHPEHGAVYPTRMMPWSACQALYPDVQVFYNPPHGLLGTLVDRLLTAIVDPHLDPGSRRIAFPTIRRFDRRLHPKSRVLGVEENAMHKAYSLPYLAQHEVINDLVGGVPIVVVNDRARDVVDIFERTQQGIVLTFHPVAGSQEFLFQDELSQSQWNMRGEAIAGPALGQRLTPYVHASRVLWMIWYNFFPDTRLDEESA
jgi:hypothetical protein